MPPFVVTMPAPLGAKAARRLKRMVAVVVVEEIHLRRLAYKTYGFQMEVGFSIMAAAEMVLIRSSIALDSTC